LSLTIAVAGALLLIGATHPVQAQDTAAAAVTACPATITACGCTITKTGTYVVTMALDAGQGLTGLSDCIDIKAKNVVLNVGDHNITGPGIGSSTGAGIHVLRSASGAFIEGDDTVVTARLISAGMRAK